MGSRAVNLRSLKLEGGEGDVKQKNVLAAGGRSKSVLKDIGNLVDDRALQGKKAVAVGKTIMARKQKQIEKKQLVPDHDQLRRKQN